MKLVRKIALACLTLAGSAAACSVAHAQSLNGAGASFPNPIYSRWFGEYSASHPGVEINYQPVGSGAGIRQASIGILDFGATDSPMTDRQMQEARIPLVHIPTVLGAVVPAYNLPGVHADLNLSGEVIAAIYLGDISNWHDPRIGRLNPGVPLPDHAILPVYRAEASGTTYVFTDFLCKTAPAFAARVGRGTTVRWPAGAGQKGNEGVAGMVRSNPYSFGYVELVYALANGMHFGAVQNAAGRFVKASGATISAAAATGAASMPDDFRVSITNAPGPESYPIASFTWLLVPLHSQDPAKARVLRAFLAWMLQHGEAEASAMSYAPLPESVARRIAAVVPNLR